MNTLYKTMLATACAAAFVAASGPARAQTGPYAPAMPDVPSDSTSTILDQSTTTTDTTTPSGGSFANPRAMALHNQAVILSHRATWAAQHGEKKLAEQLAGQAEQLYVRSWNTTGLFAHRMGE